MSWGVRPRRAPRNQLRHKPNQGDLTRSDYGADEETRYEHQPGGCGRTGQSIEDRIAAATARGRHGHAAISPLERTRGPCHLCLPEATCWSPRRGKAASSSGRVARPRRRAHREIDLSNLPQCGRAEPQSQTALEWGDSTAEYSDNSDKPARLRAKNQSRCPHSDGNATIGVPRQDASVLLP